MNASYSERRVTRPRPSASRSPGVVRTDDHVCLSTQSILINIGGVRGRVIGRGSEKVEEQIGRGVDSLFLFSVLYLSI